MLDVTFPDPLDYDVIVPLGARWAVYDDRLADRWVGAEIDMVRRALTPAPVFSGVCFGGQLLAHRTRRNGGTLSPPEVGWHEVHSDDRPWFRRVRGFQWRRDRLTAPPGSARDRPETAARHRLSSPGGRWELQFHPEVGPGLAFEQWIAEDDGGDIPGPRGLTPTICGPAPPNFRRRRRTPVMTAGGGFPRPAHRRLPCTTRTAAGLRPPPAQPHP